MGSDIDGSLPGKSGEGEGMGKNHIRQGVRAKTVSEKRLTDERYFEGFWLGVYTFILVITLSAGQAAFALVMLLGWMALAPFVVYNLFCHIFVAEDGCYLVKWGWAVHIPWEQIKSAEVIVAYRHSQIRLCFLPGILDEVTGTPVVIKEGRDNLIAYSETVLNCLKRHAPVTVSAE